MADKTETQKPETQKIEVGGTGEAKVQFKDATGGEVKVKSVDWSSDSPSVVVSGDDKEPTTAKLFAPGAGPATITAVGVGEDGGRVTISTTVVAVSKGAAASGAITLSVQPAPAKPKAEGKPAEATAHTR